MKKETLYTVATVALTAIAVRWLMAKYPQTQKYFA